MGQKLIGQCCANAVDVDGQVIQGDVTKALFSSEQHSLCMMQPASASRERHVIPTGAEACKTPRFCNTPRAREEVDDADDIPDELLREVTDFREELTGCCHPTYTQYDAWRRSSSVIAPGMSVGASQRGRTNHPPKDVEWNSNEFIAQLNATAKGFSFEFAPVPLYHSLDRPYPVPYLADRP